MSTNHRFRRLAAAVTLLALHAAADRVAAQAPDPLTLAEAIAIARANNPDYRIQENQSRSADWDVRTAYGNLLPSVSSSTGVGYSAPGQRRLDSVVFGEQPGQISSRYSLGVSLSFSGASLLAPGEARAQSRATDQNIRQAAASLESNVTQRYLAVLEARDAVAQSEREVERTGEHVRLAAARFQVGAGTQLDVRRAEVQQGQAQVRLLQSRNSAANEVLLLGQVLGVSLPEEVELSESFSLFSPEWQIADLLGIARSKSPVLLASRAQVDAADIRVRSARTAYLPTVSFSTGLSGYMSQASSTAPLIAQELQRAQASYSGCLQQNELYAEIGWPTANCTDPGLPGFESELRDRIERQNSGFPFDFIRQPWNAGISLSLPIFNGLSRERGIEDARIGRSNAQHQVRAQEMAVEVEVRSALRNLQTAYETSLLQEQNRLMAEEELVLAEERFRFGITTSVEVTDAQSQLGEAERAEIASVYAFHRTLAILEALLGERLAR